MNRAAPILLFLAWITLPPVEAAEPPVLFPPGNIACTMEIVDHTVPPPPSDESKGKPHIFTKKAEITRTGELVYVKLTLSDGSISEIWQPGKLALTFLLEPGSPRLKVRRGNDYLPPVYHLDRKTVWFDWISDDCLKEEVTYRGIKCHRYEKTVRLPGDEPGQLSTESAVFQAWIDVKTRLPVAFDDERRRYDITFKGATAPLVMPPSVQRELQAYEALLSPAKRL